MQIKPIETVIDAEKVLNLVGKDFNFDHAKGIAELLKNSVDAYNIDGVPDEKQVILISLRTTQNDFIKQIEVIDFCGMTKQKIDKGFVHWFSNVAASLTKQGKQTNEKTLGGHGNGGKFYMRQMFGEAYLITYLNRKLNIFGFDEFKRYGYNEKFKDLSINPEEAIRIADLESKEIPEEIMRNVLSGKSGFTIIRGVNPAKTKDTSYRLKLAEKIINNPQAQRLIKHKKIYFQSLPNKKWTHLTVPSIRPKQGFESPQKYVCPALIELDGRKIEMINDEYSESITLTLYTSESPLTGSKYKYLNRIDFLGKIGVVASYHLSEIGPFSSGFTEFIYGECSCPIMEDPNEDYVRNDRAEFVRGDKSESLLKWVQECITNLTAKLEEQQRNQRRSRDLQNTSNFNKILNTWNHQFISAMLKDQLFGNGNETGIGGNDEQAPIIGKMPGQKSGKKATKRKGSSGETDVRKAPKHPVVLVSSHDSDPLSEDGRTYDCDPRQPAVHQRPIDVAYGIYWINTSKPLAELILKKDGAESSRWRHYLFQRHTDIIIKEAIFHMGKSELNLTSDAVNQKIDEIIAAVHDKATEDLVKFLFDEKYEV